MGKEGETVNNLGWGKNIISIDFCLKLYPMSFCFFISFFRTGLFILYS